MQTIILRGEAQRRLAHQLVERAPPNAVVTFKEETRNNEQNSKMQAMLSDVSRAKPEGRVMPPEIWKCLFMASCGHKVKFYPDLDGESMVPIGFKSSRLTKAKFSELIECIYEYGARHGVVWSEPVDRKAA